jgi:hypothetical protein
VAWCRTDGSIERARIAEFQRETGIRANVRYGGTAELAALLQEEGEKERLSPSEGRREG